MIFASLQIERDPPRWAELIPLLGYWLQVAGGVAAIALVFWAIHYFAERKYLQQKKLTSSGLVFLVLCGLSVACYLGFLAMVGVQGLHRMQLPMGADPSLAGRLPVYYTWEQYLLLTGGGFFALAAVLAPMLAGLATRLSFRRVGAIARLSVKEATRQKVIYAFLIIALIFLFAPYFVSFRDEDQLRNYVMLIHTAMAPLFLVTAAFLGAFSIPNDVQRQTIHTVVTKPVEKYEIVLGRFLGYGFLLTAILAVLSVISLGYVVRGVNERAAEQSYKARVPVFSDFLDFIGTSNPGIGENVGREWTYRSYIRGRVPGTPEKQQYAFWRFYNLPAQLAASSDPVKFEFTFDIFRTTKGKEGQGVFCTLTFITGYISEQNMIERAEEMTKKLQAARFKLEKDLEAQNLDSKTLEARLASETERLKNELAEEYGVYRAGGTEVTDYHTQSVTVPAGLFKRAAKDKQLMAGVPANQQPPELMVFVNVEGGYSAAQYVGVAKRDLYILSTELPFWQNFFKMMIGLWCNTVLVLGVAIACSTYLSGIISLLTTMFLLGAGAVVDYIRTLAMGIAPGGGPFEAFNRLLYRIPVGAELEQTAAAQIGTGADEAFRWVLGYILNLIPDIHRFNLTEYVAEGFNISWGQIIFLDNVLPLVGYLIPWAIFAYYWINFREIANPT